MPDQFPISVWWIVVLTSGVLFWTPALRTLSSKNSPLSTPRPSFERRIGGARVGKYMPVLQPISYSQLTPRDRSCATRLRSERLVKTVALPPPMTVREAALGPITARLFSRAKGRTPLFFSRTQPSDAALCNNACCSRVLGEGFGLPGSVMGTGSTCDMHLAFLGEQIGLVALLWSGLSSGLTKALALREPTVARREAPPPRPETETQLGKSPSRAMIFSTTMARLRTSAMATFPSARSFCNRSP
mmetsp:Transcript_42550/g.114765  ORF Transcript_42550/g.114765 Transcript_42550/m.114765 type:complete len:245 (+) Transcript_42550:1307-2041(+)